MTELMQDQPDQFSKALYATCSAALGQLDDLETKALQSHVFNQKSAAYAEQQQELRRLRAAPDFWGHWRPEGSTTLGGPDIDYMLFDKYADMDMDDMWRAVRDYEQHVFPLESRRVAEQFFEELEGAWTIDEEHATHGFLSPEGRARWDMIEMNTEQDEDILGFSRRIPNSKKQAWVPRAAMTLPPRKTTSQKRMEKDLAEAEAQAHALRKQGFPANPIPASILIPKYAAIMANRSTKSAIMRAEASRDASRRAKPHGLLIEAPRQSPEPRPASGSPSPGKAQPPRLVAEAAEDGVRRRQRLEENEGLAGMTNEHIFKPAINDGPPNFPLMQAQFAEALLMRKKAHTPIIPRPFPGVEAHHARPVKSKHQCKSTKHVPRPALPAKQAASVTSPPPRKTFSSKLKESYRKELEKKREMEKQQEEKSAADKEEQRKKLQSQIRAHLGLTVGKPRTQIEEERRSEFQTRQKQKDREYLRRLKEMRARVESRPCLFEQVHIMNAKRKAIADYESILEDHGLKRDDFGSDRHISQNPNLPGKAGWG
ncbi:hypothetical protein DFJ77DRAFT_319631 [Powellomyces hirtus]|nr:hypothetical protein DFJ77DRAFT_319631 [Powellomyces hirtus]